MVCIRWLTGIKAMPYFGSTPHFPAPCVSTLCRLPPQYTPSTSDRPLELGDGTVGNSMYLRVVPFAHCGSASPVLSMCGACGGSVNSIGLSTGE
jgi:hypothetical protein